MRASTYPPAVRTYLKIVPACVIYLYLASIHPLMVYNILFHSKERIDRLFYRRTRFEKHASRRDDIYRNHWLRQINEQPYGKDRYTSPLVPKL